MKFKNKKIIIGISLMISLLCFSNTVKAEKTITVVEYREKSGFDRYLNDDNKKDAIYKYNDKNYYYYFNGSEKVASKYVGNTGSGIRFFSVKKDSYSSGNKNYVFKMLTENLKELYCEYTYNSYPVAQIIKEYNNEESSYYYTELAINNYFGENFRLTDNYGFNNHETTYTDIINKAKEENYDKITFDGVTESTNEELDYDEDNEIWESANIRVKNLNDAATLEITMTNKAGKEFNNYAHFSHVKNDGNDKIYKIVICKNSDSKSSECEDISEELSAGTYTITIKAKKNLPYAKFYECYADSSKNDFYYAGYSSELVTPDTVDATMTTTLTIKEDNTNDNDTDSDKDKDDNDKTNTSATNKKFSIAFKFSSDYVKNVEFSIYDAIKNNKCTGNKIYSTKSNAAIMDTTAVTSTTGKYCLHVTDATDSYLIPSDEDISNKTDITVTLAKPQIKIEFINSNKESIADVKFNIYDNIENNTCSGNKLITNDVSSLNKLFIQHTKASSTGKYCLKVSEVPDGYEIPSDSIVKLTNNTSNVNTITLKKEVEVETSTTGSIKISVVDKDKKLLENVKFKICTDKECENEKYNVTSTDEVYSVPNVPFDTYYVKIISVPDGYVLPKEPIKLELNEEKPNVTKTITIDATTKVPDTLSNISKLLILCGIVGIISGTVLVYTNAKKQEQV